MFGDEKGQALPMALVVLGLGALMIAPFLGHVSTNLIGSRIYESATEERFSSDAGVEHAIWRLTNDGLAEQLPDAGDSISYQCNEINGNVPDITVTTESAGAPGEPGEILDEIIDSFEFDIHSCWSPFIIPVSSDVFAIAYWGSGFDGHLKTVRIDSDGQIDDTVIDSITFQSWSGWAPYIIHISGDIYAVAYRGPWLNGFIKTIQIAPDGQIADSIIDTFEFDTSAGWKPFVIRVSGNIYAVVYWGFFNDGLINTIQITPDGQIADSVIDTLEFDNIRGWKPSFLHVTGEIFAVVYRGEDYDGFVKTIQIAPDGQISDTIIDTLEFDNASGREPSVTHIADDIYAIAYRGPYDDGFVKTIQIAADGQIADSVIDTLEFDDVDGREPSIIPVANDIYVIAYCGPYDDGFVKTIQIGADGQIADSVIDTLEFDDVNGRTPSIVPVTDEIYAIAYRGRANDGYLTTVQIVTEEDAAVYEVISTAGSVTIRARVEISGETVNILSWVVD
jgi:hypothetical protein